MSLLSAATVLRDKVHDEALPASTMTRRPVLRWADRLDLRATPALLAGGIDLRRVRDALVGARESELRGSDVLADWTQPVSDAYAAVFEPLGLEDIGRRIGRVTLLADAVADQDDDARNGAPNPILSGACSAEDACQLVRQDVVTVRRAVEKAVPGSLAALLWGPGFSRGVARTIGEAQGDTCGQVTSELAPLSAGDNAPQEPLPHWPANQPVDEEVAEQEHRVDNPREHRSRWADSCDPCDGCFDCGTCCCAGDACCDC